MIILRQSTYLSLINVSKAYCFVVRTFKNYWWTFWNFHFFSIPFWHFHVLLQYPMIKLPSITLYCPTLSIGSYSPSGHAVERYETLSYCNHQQSAVPRMGGPHSTFLYPWRKLQSCELVSTVAVCSRWLCHGRLPYPLALRLSVPLSRCSSRVILSFEVHGASWLTADNMLWLDIVKLTFPRWACTASHSSPRLLPALEHYHALCFCDLACSWLHLQVSICIFPNPLRIFPSVSLGGLLSQYIEEIRDSFEENFRETLFCLQALAVRLVSLAPLGEPTLWLQGGCRRLGSRERWRIQKLRTRRMKVEQNFPHVSRYSAG